MLFVILQTRLKMTENEKFNLVHKLEFDIRQFNSRGYRTYW